MSQTNWEADKMLDVYIYDYLVKKNLNATAKAFQAEGKVSSDPVAIDAPGGFLFEWWSVFWDIFIARTNDKHSEVATSYIQAQLAKAKEQEQQQPLQQHQQQQQQQIQMHQLLLQRHAQQQGREGAHLINGNVNGFVSLDSLTRQNPGAANALATKLYEERLKSPLQRDTLDETSIKQRFGENVGQMVDSGHASLLKPAGTPGQGTGHVLAGALSGSLQQCQARIQQVPGLAQDIKPQISSVLNSRGSGPDGSLIGISGSNQAANNLTLKGWPLTGLDPHRAGLLQQQKSLTQSPQSVHQLQFLSPQQQQLLLQAQAQQSLTSSSAGDIDTRRLKMLLNNRNMIPGKDGQPDNIGDGIPSMGSPLQTQSPILPLTDTDMLIKKIAQLQQQQSGSQQQLALSGQHSQSSNYLIHQPEKLGSGGSMTADGSMSNSFKGVDQNTKNPSGRKRKQSSSGPANSSGTANTTGPSPSSAPSTPSTQTPGDMMSISQLQHKRSSSKPVMMFSDGTGTLTSNQSAGMPRGKAEMERFVEDGALEDNVESFLSQDDTDPRDVAGRAMGVGKGFTFTEIRATRASTNKVVCCHFSTDGKLLATGGHDKKAVLWHTDTLKLKSTLEEHSLLITDIRFSPNMQRLATSSFDKTVRVWDAENPGYSLRTFTGHSSSVMSLDFHPNKDDLICSCDGDGEMRYWSINNGSCTKVFKQGGTTQMRFQPRHGRYLAAASENSICVVDVDTLARRHLLQGHKKHVDSVCWNPSGDYLASVSEDSVRVWSLGSGSDGDCAYELSCNGNKFHSCVFHPTYPSLLVIGCYQSIELWDMAENRTMTLAAHEGLISALDVSNAAGLVASVSHDKFLKVWK